jgi:small subunit ribosomal protein S17e
MEVLILGNIRQTNIKNIAYNLLRSYPNEFKKNDFQHNKLKVAGWTDVKSKVLRNRIAGYITRILSPKQRKESGGFNDQ